MQSEHRDPVDLAQRLRQFYIRILGEASVERRQHVVLRAALDGEQERETELRSR